VFSSGGAGGRLSPAIDTRMRGSGSDIDRI
jgi:hypothetical protein